MNHRFVSTLFALLAMLAGGCGDSESAEPVELPKALAEAFARLERAGYDVHSTTVGRDELPAIVIEGESDALVVAVPIGQGLPGVDVPVQNAWDGPTVTTGIWERFCRGFLISSPDDRTADRVMTVSRVCR
jgi:hypothetical protein